MRKSDLLKILKEHIGRTANEQNAHKTANAIYFVFKQNAVSVCDRKTYIPILKRIKTYLKDDFHWDMVKIHECFCELNRLLKY
jgi:hypothetical protein